MESGSATNDQKLQFQSKTTRFDKTIVIDSVKQTKEKETLKTLLRQFEKKKIKE